MTAKADSKTAAKKSPASKSPASRTSASKAPAKKVAKHASEDNYTDPDLRDRIKAEVTAGDKGGRPGQWSARKAQLVAHEYEAQGGGYKHERTEAQQSLKDWGDEKWHTESGAQAIHGDTTSRYLPDEAWKQLTPAQKQATDRKKQAASAKGQQFVPNTAAAKTARKRVQSKCDQ